MNLSEETLKHRERFLTAVTATEFSIKDRKCELTEWADQSVQRLLEIRKSGQRLYFIGNGASSAMSSHFSTDFTKNGNFSAFALTDPSLITCFSNDYSYADAFGEMLKRHFKKGDGLVAISSSGKSENVLRAVRLCRDLTPDAIFTFSGFTPTNPLQSLGSHNLYVPDTTFGMVESSHSYYLHVLIDLICGL